MRRELRKLAGSPDASHRMHPKRPVLTGLKLRELYKTDLTPDTDHRTHRPASGACRPVPVVRCLTLAGPGTVCTGRSDAASGAQKPASGECFLSEKHSHDFSKFPNGAIEKMHRTHPLSTLQTPPPSQSMPTPQSVYQQVCTCVSIFTNIFFEGVKLAH